MAKRNWSLFIAAVSFGIVVGWLSRNPSKLEEQIELIIAGVLVVIGITGLIAKALSKKSSHADENNSD
ncbi:MAG: hypothetical protein PHO27_12670 [Sulfuricurvum sp.]|nr:hypothetical protein [Sulfuricurvum sp.]